MEFEDIETLEGALTWLSEQREISNEQFHILLKQFMPDGADTISDFVEQAGITRTGEPGM